MSTSVGGGETVDGQVIDAFETLPSQPTDPLAAYDLVCMSHLRWDFVYQRPQHLMSRFAQKRRVFFVEEPIYSAGPTWLNVSRREDHLYVVNMHLPPDLSLDAGEAMQRNLLDQLFVQQGIEQHVAWYYTPMMLGITDQLTPTAIVYDCMDELSAFALAPPLLKEREQELLNRADLVFTGGQSLYEAKHDRHPRVFCFPSSVDVQHFAQARTITDDPADQALIARPRLGFFGVIDERMDLDLLTGLADARPAWQIVVLGPVVKIDPAVLPQRPNLHYLGSKHYKELPAYLAGWDVALLPFARNESTRFISPTKTPEYLAAGKPVVSTPIHDVVRPYGEQGLVWIGETVDEWVAAIEAALDDDANVRQERVDAFLAQTSWDRTWAEMNRLIAEVVTQPTRTAT